MNNKIILKATFSIVITLLFLFLTSYISFVFLGGIIFIFLGLKYTTLLSLLKFLTIYFIVSFPIDFFLNGFLNFSKNFKNLSKIQCDLLSIAIDIPLNMVIIGFLESILSDISCSMLVAFLFCIIFEMTNFHFNKV